MILDGLDDFARECMYKTMEVLGREMRQKMQAYIKENDIMAWAKLYASITNEVLRRNGYIQTTIKPNMYYAIWVHDGTEPHMPPIQPILEWVQVKRGRLGKSFLGDRSDVSTAWAVATNIKKFGTKGHPFVDITFNQNRQFILDRFNDMVKEIVHDYSN